MIFRYEEIKEYVTADFERFHKLNFDEDQMYPAVLDEYQHAKNFSRTENICIHVILALNYAKHKWDCTYIIDNLKMLKSDEIENELKTDLGNEYINFYKDVSGFLP